MEATLLGQRETERTAFGPRSKKGKGRYLRRFQEKSGKRLKNAKWLIPREGMARSKKGWVSMRNSSWGTEDI